MPLPAPNLDDRRFQDLVDDAKRILQQRLPQWNEHNVSDPGVTLIELFAWMTDQLLYRLNRVPDLHYVKFLELIGLKRFPPTPARAPITFWFAGPTTERVILPRGTRTTTRRTELEEQVEFTTLDDLAVIPAGVLSVRSSVEPDRTRGHDEELLREDGFLCFNTPPRAGDTLLIGLTEPVPKNIVVLEIRARIEGIGVDPDHPPLVWEAWSGTGWVACDVDSDETGGLNRDGQVILHIPPTHEASVIAKQRAGWVRARIVEAVENQPVYSASPQIFAVRAHTIGGTEMSVNAALVDLETLPPSDGSPGQRFTLQHRNIVTTADTVVEVANGDSDAGWVRWTPVQNFAESTADDLHYMIDGVEGELVLGPAVRLENGTLAQYGKVPPKGAVIRVRNFAHGGGSLGNVNKGAVDLLASSFPGIAKVENRQPGMGGREAEDMENAKSRGPILLRTRNRAVTAEDYEFIAAEAAPEIARVKCVAAGVDNTDPGAVRVLIVPDLPDDYGRLPFEKLLPSDESLAKVTKAIESRRVIGARVSIEPPFYQGLTVVARVKARQEFHPVRLQEQALTALYRYFNPLIGGPDGKGWPFGRPLLLGEVYAVLQRLPGVELIDDARLFGADPISGRRGQAAQRIDIGSNALVFSYDHQVMVET